MSLKTENLEFELAQLMKEHGIQAVVAGVGNVINTIAETLVLEKNGGHRNSIDFRKWEDAAVAIGNLADRTERLPAYPPYHA